MSPSERFRSKSVVVLGGAGFLGSHLCDRLLAEGAARVVSVDNLCTGDLSNHAAHRGEPRFEFVQQDICDGLKISGAVDFVFNLASPASPFDYAKLWLETMRVGSLGTQHGLELAEAKHAVFLQASTSEVYGDPLVHPQREDYLGNVDPTGPRAVYDEAKRYGEAMVTAFRRERGLSTRIVRIFNTYGPRMRLNDGRVVPAFVGQALRGENFTVFGDGSQTRSFCYVDDEVEGIVRLALSGEMDPVNIGNPNEMTLLQLAEAVRAAAGGGGAIELKPLPRGDPKQRKPDISRAKKLLGWAPKVSLAEGLKPTIEFFAVEESKQAALLSRQYGVPVVRLKDLDVDPKVIALVPRDVAEKHFILPVSQAGESLIVAMCDPSNSHAVADLKSITGLEIEPVVTSESAIRNAIEKYYGPK